MGGLFASLHTASGALAAFSKALGVESQNVSNAATPGYAAQRATIRPVEVGGASAGGDSVQITSTSNAQLDALVQAASAQAGFSGAQVSQLSPVNSTFDITGSSGILAAFQQFSSAFANVAADPNNQSLRSLALSAAGSVANEFQSAANALSAQQTQTNTAIQSTVSQINSLAADIQQINSGISVNGASGSSDATLRNTLDQLSSLIDIQVQTNQNGTVTVLAAGQIPLVSGTQTSALSVNMSNPPGQQVSSSAWGGTTANVGGQLGALLDFNNSTLASLTGSGSQQGSLNVLAQSFADSVNTLLTSGQTTAGNPGAPLFTYDSSNGGVNVAATLSVDPSVTADQLALASGTQSNGVANSLSQLASTTDPTQQINGLSPTDYYAAIASGIGQQLSTATNQSSADQGALTSAQATRQQQTGVSLDAEAINITADQRAYEASAQLVTVLDQLTQDTIQLLGSQGAA
jgi:flagellar hook-associated protein 1 FlgK